MVWGLFPLDPLSGENQFYIFRNGTYKVGRKGCDIIVVKDKGVSRVHAEIVVDEMVCMDNILKKSSKSSSGVRVRDCSKYGTFISNGDDVKVKVQEFSNKETMLNDGDIVSFGTGNANYRFCFVSFVFFLRSFDDPLKMKQLQDMIASVGASVTRKWSLQCTHVVVDNFIHINNDIIDPILAKKPIVGSSWVELIARETISTEVPIVESHTPTLMLEGVRVKVCDPESREHCLEGYTFVLEPSDKYKFKKKLQLILEAGGAKVILEAPPLYSQSIENHVVCVIPAGMTSSSKSNSLPKVKETELLAAVVSGHLDPSIIIRSAPVLVTSSCSTDETVVADSDVEIETAISAEKSVAVHVLDSSDDKRERNMMIQKNSYAENIRGTSQIIESTKDDSRENISALQESSEDERERNMLLHTAKYAENACRTAHVIEPSKQDSKGNTAEFQSAYTYTSPVKSDVKISLSTDRVDGFVGQKNLDHASESGPVDIIFSQDLIVRDSNSSQSGRSSTSVSSINFKRFRKTSVPSGNSFNNLIPFSRNPYHHSDYGNEDAAESVREEKKRKETEAIVEDLFNHEKGRKRGASGHLHGLFARG